MRFIEIGSFVQGRGTFRWCCAPRVRVRQGCFNIRRRAQKDSANNILLRERARDWFAVFTLRLTGKHWSGIPCRVAPRVARCVQSGKILCITQVPAFRVWSFRSVKLGGKRNWVVSWLQGIERIRSDGLGWHRLIHDLIHERTVGPVLQ